MTKRQRKPRLTPSSIYLGDIEDRKRREKALDELAERLGAPNRSQLIQMIADGEVALEKKESSPGASGAV